MLYAFARNYGFSQFSKKLKISTKNQYLIRNTIWYDKKFMIINIRLKYCKKWLLVMFMVDEVFVETHLKFAE